MAEFSRRESFTAKMSPKHDGAPRVHVRGDYGAGYLMSKRVDIEAIRVLSFSPCFILPDDVSPHRDF